VSQGAPKARRLLHQSLSTIAGGGNEQDIFDASKVGYRNALRVYAYGQALSLQKGG
jgi:hypothetical protein